MRSRARVSCTTAISKQCLKYMYAADWYMYILLVCIDLNADMGLCGLLKRIKPSDLCECFYENTTP